MAKVTLRIDDRDIETEDGKTLLEAARDAGIYIPTLCHHPALAPTGACRLCSVEVEKNGRKKVVTSCNYPVEGGLEVKTSSPDLFHLRAMILELLLARCPKEPKIANLAKEHGVSSPRFRLADESCILCGLCARVCSELVGVSAISPVSRGVERAIDAPYGDFSKDCIDCGACALICPTSAVKKMKNIYPLTSEETREIESRFLRGEMDEGIGVYSDILACRAHREGQDGGAVTSMLSKAIERGTIDAAVVVLPGEEYRAEATIAENVEAVLESRGTKYLRVPVIPKLFEALRSGKKRLAVVGTPCQIRAARKLELDGSLSEEFPDAEIVLIGLFCFESFDREELRRHIQDMFATDIEKADRIQIGKGKFSIFKGGEEHSCKVSDLEGDVNEGCRFCGDFVSRLADISVGSVGSPEGYSTVIVRSEPGRRLLEGVDRCDVEVNLEEIAKLNGIKRRRSERRFKKIVDGLQR